MVQVLFSASIVIVVDTVWAVRCGWLMLKKRSDAAISIPPLAPTEGRNATLFANSAPIVSTNRLHVQVLICVSCRQTIVAPVDNTWFRTDARLAPSFKPLTFQHSRLQFLADIMNNSYYLLTTESVKALVWFW